MHINELTPLATLPRYDRTPSQVAHDTIRTAAELARLDAYAQNILHAVTIARTAYANQSCAAADSALGVIAAEVPRLIESQRDASRLVCAEAGL